MPEKCRWQASKACTRVEQEVLIAEIVQGEVITDCISLSGSMSCPVGGGYWAKCASKAVLPDPPRVPLVVPPYFQPNGFFVTNRTTATGELCRLPVMYK